MTVRDPLAGKQRVDAVLERRAHPRQDNAVAEQITQVTQLTRSDIRLRQQVGAEQVGKRARVDRVRLHARSRDRLRAQRMRETQLVPLLLEQIGEPFPAVGRLERDLQLAAQLSKDRLQRLRLVDHPAREQLRPGLVERGDLRALAMEIDADVDHLLGPPSSPDVLVSSGIAPAEDEAQEARFFMASSLGSRRPPVADEA
jgi:hypothetical protein